jgi:hypothetical protein
MKVAIMQPYFLPYIGYFQLIHAVDKFVIYDNIQFSKKGWFHRNRFLNNGKDEFFTIPLKKDSDFLNVNQRFLGDNYVEEKAKTLRKVKESYKKAPYFDAVFPIVENIFNYDNPNLFNFIHNSLLEILNVLNIKTEIVISSSINIDHGLKSQEKVLALSKALNASLYLNPIGGTGLYESKKFQENNIELLFIKSNPIAYAQFKNEFVPWLSIIDLLMFNSKDKIIDWLSDFSLIKN